MNAPLDATWESLPDPGIATLTDRLRVAGGWIYLFHRR